MKVICPKHKIGMQKMCVPDYDKIKKKMRGWTTTDWFYCIKCDQPFRVKITLSKAKRRKSKH